MSAHFQSDHFTLHELAAGVYAAIATEGGAGFSNAGLIDLGDRTLAFDAFENPQAAEDLARAAVHLTSRTPAQVIISHWHPDHWGGAQVFAGSVILSTQATRQEMLPIAKEMLREKKNIAAFENDIRKEEARLAKENDLNKQRSLVLSIARQRHSLHALPMLDPTLPNQTFEGKMIFYGSKRSVELIATGKGHTLSDCVLKLSEDRVAFIGDLGFFQSQPFMPYGFPGEWVTLLENMVTWEIERFVPGHGLPGNKADLILEADYIRALEDLVRQVVLAKGTLKDALRQTLPPPFDAWQATGQRFEANVRAAFQRQTAA